MDMYHSASLLSQLYPDSAKESCLPSKYDDKVAGSDLLDSPCVNGLMFDYGKQKFVIDTKSIKPVWACLRFKIYFVISSFAFNLLYNSQAKSFSFQGESKKNKCRDDVEQIFPKVNCSYATNQCTLFGVYIPPTNTSRFMVGFLDLFKVKIRKKKVFKI